MSTAALGGGYCACFRINGQTTPENCASFGGTFCGEFSTTTTTTTTTTSYTGPPTTTTTPSGHFRVAMGWQAVAVQSSCFRSTSGWGLVASISCRLENRRHLTAKRWDYTRNGAMLRTAMPAGGGQSGGNLEAGLLSGSLLCEYQSFTDRPDPPGNAEDVWDEYAADPRRRDVLRTSQTELTLDFRSWSAMLSMPASTTPERRPSAMPWPCGGPRECMQHPHNPRGES